MNTATKGLLKRSIHAYKEADKKTRKDYLKIMTRNYEVKKQVEELYDMKKFKKDAQDYIKATEIFLRIHKKL